MRATHERVLWNCHRGCCSLSVLQRGLSRAAAIIWPFQHAVLGALSINRLRGSGRLHFPVRGAVWLSGQLGGIRLRVCPDERRRQPVCGLIQPARHDDHVNRQAHQGKNAPDEHPSAKLARGKAEHPARQRPRGQEVPSLGLAASGQRDASLEPSKRDEQGPRPAQTPRVHGELRKPPARPRTSQDEDVRSTPDGTAEADSAGTSGCALVASGLSGAAPRLCCSAAFLRAPRAELPPQAVAAAASSSGST